mmetsp:Transcript_71325/g.209376  ORF Transcript_71325/g.209376 Transcript_71325/m.209376 type:complete len:267 (-) Transcript_71325:386-1186(-)
MWVRSRFGMKPWIWARYQQPLPGQQAQTSAPMQSFGEGGGFGTGVPLTKRFLAWQAFAEASTRSTDSQRREAARVSASRLSGSVAAKIFVSHRTSSSAATASFERLPHRHRSAASVALKRRLRRSRCTSCGATEEAASTFASCSPATSSGLAPPSPQLAASLSSAAANSAALRRTRWRGAAPEATNASSTPLKAEVRTSARSAGITRLREASCVSASSLSSHSLNVDPSVPTTPKESAAPLRAPESKAASLSKRWASSSAVTSRSA